MPKITHTIPHIELCLWYSEAIQGQETDSRRIVLYSLILPNPSIHPLQNQRFSNRRGPRNKFQTSLFKSTKVVASMASSRPRRNKKELSLRTGRGHSAALYYSHTKVKTVKRHLQLTSKEKFTSHSLRIYNHHVGIWRQNDVVSMSMRRDHVVSTLIRRHFYVMCPLGRTFRNELTVNISLDAQSYRSPDDLHEFINDLDLI